MTSGSGKLVQGRVGVIVSSSWGNTDNMGVSVTPPLRGTAASIKTRAELFACSRHDGRVSEMGRNASKGCISRKAFQTRVLEPILTF